MQQFGVSFFYFSKIFWIGDLNYRIDDKNIEEVKRKIGEKEYTDILQNDQVRS